MLEDYLFGIGFDDSEINTIQKMLPKTMVSESTLLYNIKNLYHYFKRNGIDNNSFKSIILITPNLLLESIENIKTKLDYFNELGFNRISFFSMLKNYLLIQHETAVKELLNEVQPEYYYTEADVKDLLLNGSLDALKDCLDYAPAGTLDLVKKLAVDLELNDVKKRDAIREMLGFNVTF